MIPQTHQLFGAVEATNANSKAPTVDSMIDKWIIMRGLTAGSAVVEVSIDGENFVPTDITIDADGVFEVPFPATHVRLNATGLTCADASLRASA